MKTKMLSLAAFAIIAMAGLSGLQAADPKDHPAVVQMNECKTSNDKCLKFAGAGSEDAKAACEADKANGCVVGCKAYINKFGGDQNWCK